MIEASLKVNHVHFSSVACNDLTAACACGELFLPRLRSAVVAMSTFLAILVSVKGCAEACVVQDLLACLHMLAVATGTEDMPQDKDLPCRTSKSKFKC